MRFNIPVTTNLSKKDIKIYQNCIDVCFYTKFVTFERYICLNKFGISLIRRIRNE